MTNKTNRSSKDVRKRKILDENIKKNYFHTDLKEYCYFTVSAAVKSDTTFSESIMNDFYTAVDFVLSHFSNCEIKEVVSNTINPEKQDIFYPLREYRVLKNGHYKTVRIFMLYFGGCCISESK